MDEIKKGDLVMVVKPLPCCMSHASIGNIFTVTGAIPKPLSECKYCGEITSSDKYGESVIVNTGAAIEKYRLRKLDPPAEGETREAYINLNINLKQEA